jgi:hypothetical protein
MAETEFAITGTNSLGSAGLFVLFQTTRSVGASEPSHLSAFVFQLCVLLCVAYAWRRWIYGDGTPKRSSRHSMWRFSNLLMLLAVASFLYSGRRGIWKVPLGDALLFALSCIMIGGAFLLRYWEDQSPSE